MTRKQRIILFSCATGAFVILSVCAAFYPPVPAGSASGPVTIPPVEAFQAAIPVLPPEGDPERSEGGFILKEIMGYIGIYDRREMSFPIYVTDINTQSLRKADQNLLKKGLFAKDAGTIAMLLEDFGS